MMDEPDVVVPMLSLEYERYMIRCASCSDGGAWVWASEGTRHVDGIRFDCRCVLCGHEFTADVVQGEPA